MVRLTSGFAADQRIDLAFGGLLVEVDAIGVERVGLALLLGRSLALLVVLSAASACWSWSTPRTGRVSDRPGALGDAVRNVVHRVVARHVLLLQEEGGMALALGEDRDQHIGARHFLAARRLHMDDGALDDALEAGGGL